MRSLNCPRLSFVPFMLGLWAHSASAQTDHVACDNRAFRTGRLIRVIAVADSTTGRISGPVVTCAAGVLQVGGRSGPDSTYSVPVESIQRLWVRDNSTRWGVIVGAAAGVAGGSALAVSKSEICFKGNPPGPATCHGNVVIDALVGGGLGAILGALVGRQLPRWVKVFP